MSIMLRNWIVVGAVIASVFGIGFCTTAAKAEDPPRITHHVLEEYPDALQAALEARDRRIASAPAGPDGIAPESVFTDSLRWPQRKVLKVAFLSGNSNLHRAVADAAKPWTEACNLNFDFGLNQGTGAYRRWSDQDTTYSADIRISFDRKGYWSLVGTDSANPNVGDPTEPDGGRPNQRSMNFGGFAEELPADFAGTVLHEFGHAIGFKHEHQHPTQGCDNDFRWLDDPGYIPTRDARGQFTEDSENRRPGIYTVLSGFPNRWPQFKVDHNLRQLPDSHAYTLRPFDRRSIMKYSFDPWMFVSGSGSHCFSAGRNEALSADDKISVWGQYPTDTSPSADSALESVAGDETPARKADRLETRRKAAINVLNQISGTPEELKTYYRELRGFPR